jgi:F-type H+-transporting ATPase subunit gamma
MASLKEIRTRIASVKSTRQITSAMKMVSAAKLRRAQETIILMRPYAGKLQEILSNISQSLENDQDNVLGKVREVNKVLLIAISSNKGLCGAFNSNVAKKVFHLLDTDYSMQSRQHNVDIIAIGRKAADLMKSKGCTITETHHEIVEHLKFELVVPLTEKVIDLFVDGEYDEIKIIYNQFRNAAIQDLTLENYLPILPQAKDSAKQKNSVDYILEPSREHIIRELIPKTLKIQLYKACCDSVASEHGARMTAMHKATENASEMINNYQLDYNKARQASITKEILEIVGGAEALKG